MDVTVIGASGYSGRELLRILARHPKVDELYATSRSYEGKKASSLHKNLLGLYDKKFQGMNAKTMDVDTVFLATPHGESMNIAPPLLDNGVKVIDLSGDYRFKNVKTYEEYYKKHTSPKLCEKSVYGLPEINRKKIKNANLIANPGCYPTSIILGLLPLARLKNKVKLKTIIVDSMTGTSGAGIKKSDILLKGELKENLKSYRIGKHQHRPEIEQELENAFKKKIKISFTPTLVPIVRGIQSNMHVKGKYDASKLINHYKKYYKKEPFVRITETPNVKNVNSTNYCDIGLWFDDNSGQAIIISVIDNLVKGAAGQAVQNMNIMEKIRETTGLKELAGNP